MDFEKAIEVMSTKYVYSEEQIEAIDELKRLAAIGYAVEDKASECKLNITIGTKVVSTVTLGVDIKTCFNCGVGFGINETCANCGDRENWIPYHPKEVRDCTTCKHSLGKCNRVYRHKQDKVIRCEPWHKCDDSFSMWEPKDTQVRNCTTCKYKHTKLQIKPEDHIERCYICRERYNFSGAWHEWEPKDDI